MFHCPAVPQSGRESKSIYVIEIVGSVPRRHSVGCLNRKVFLLNYDMGTLIQIELSATLSPDIFTIAQPLLWDQDKGGRECASSNSVKEFSQSQHVLHSANKQRKVFLDALCLGSRKKNNRNNLNAVLLLFFLFCFILFLYLNVIQSKTSDTF